MAALKMAAEFARLHTPEFRWPDAMLADLAATIDAAIAQERAEIAAWLEEREGGRNEIYAYRDAAAWVKARGGK